jgi:hypothetical protein
VIVGLLLTGLAAAAVWVLLLVVVLALVGGLGPHPPGPRCTRSRCPTRPRHRREPDQGRRPWPPGPPPTRAAKGTSHGLLRTPHDRPLPGPGGGRGDHPGTGATWRRGTPNGGSSSRPGAVTYDPHTGGRRDAA